MPLLQKPRRQLGGPDAGKSPPGGGHASKLPGSFEKAQLHDPLEEPLALVLILGSGDVHPGHTPGGLSPHRQHCSGRVELLPGGEGHLGAVCVLSLVHRPLLGEKGQQALLHGIAVVVSRKNQFHCPSACLI